MAAKKPYTSEQEEQIHQAAMRVWNREFKGQPKAQIKYGLAIGVSQQTISKLITGEYTPSPKVATEIAVLDGKESLEDLIGDYPVAEAAPAAIESGVVSGPPSPEPFPNLTACLNYHKGSKHWSNWTLAAARAGFFGNVDFAPYEWGPKLDSLEKGLERLRKTG